MNYNESRKWSDKFIPAIKKIVGPLLIGEADFELDTQQNTDLILMTARDLRIAARVRKHQYAQRYPNDFTIRAYAGGHKTEAHKIMEGYGDCMFYGFSDESECRIIRWFFIDLDVFRHNIKRCKSELRYGYKNNVDGSTKLAWFDLTSFTPEILIASSDDVNFEVTG